MRAVYAAAASEVWVEGLYGAYVGVYSGEVVRGEVAGACVAVGGRHDHEVYVVVGVCSGHVFEAGDVSGVGPGRVRVVAAYHGR